MRRKTLKKIKYLFLFILIIITLYRVTPTFAKFSNDYVTDNDVVGLDLNFDVKLTNIEEYEELRIDSKSYEIFNINISNGTDQKVYYGIWYKMVLPKELTDDIIIARLEDNRVSLNGELDGNEEKTASIIIKNTSTEDIIVNIGVASSDTGIQDIEYLGGKYFITGSDTEVDYYYDEAGKKYISTIDSNVNFMLGSQVFNDPDTNSVYNIGHKGVYQVEAWGASMQSEKGLYGVGTVKLAPPDKLYLYVGRENQETTEIRLMDGEKDDITSINSTIMRVGHSIESSYISGYAGMITNYLDDKLKDKCKNNSEDVVCSYHPSGIIFKNIKLLDSTKEISSPDGKGKIYGNTGNGGIKITPIVPTLDIPKIQVSFGTVYDISGIKCIDNGSGCHIIKTKPDNTNNLPVGEHSMNIIVMDDDGITYRYTAKIQVVE